ncbi:(2Fe-2S)-binding protein [Roseomonas sp. OT10]|nr:(2Fe-2S)-binding protein [Roseomonas sp. OT10]UFN51057.1 (2Fe-2S)-binding protein [Roseomonas sp. OT10]
MYVCLCNGLTDRHVRDAVASGAERPCEVYSRCGCKAQCGTCVRMILSHLRTAGSQAPQPKAA